MSPARRAVAAAVALLTLAGCRDLVRRAFSPPRAVFRRIELQQLGFGGGRLAVALELYNPNGYALSATGARYQLFVDDSFPVGTGATTDTVRVAAHDSALVRLPLDVQWSELRAAGVDVLRAGSAHYRIAGDVDVATPVGSYAVPLDARGEARLGLSLP